MNPPVELFVRLFRGRGDARGSWGGPAIRETLTPEHFHRHLSSPDEHDWFGVYNVIGDRCSWGCVDIDTNDYALARNIRGALHHRGVPAWIEQTTRGYHVWCFPAEPLVSADIMRRALTGACHAVGYSPKEVFPKQTRVTGSGLGNFVRLPFNGFCSRGTHIPRMFMEWNEADMAWPMLEDFLAEMDCDRADTARLEQLAATVPRPQRVDIDVDFQTGLEVEPVIANIGGLAYRIWRDGPLHGNDRSGTLVHLAHLLAERGVQPQTAGAVLASADDRWGKGFLDRGEPGQLIMARIIERAYSRAV